MLMQGITYNTMMGLVVGVIILMVPLFMRSLDVNPGRSVSGFGWGFIAAGGFLAFTGMHMTLTWPLEQIEGVFCCAVDNVTFGEPAAIYGLLTLIAGFAILRAEDRAERGLRELDMVATLRPILYIAAVAGFAIVLFGIAGLHFGQWRPPTVEPIARLLAGNMIEPLMVFSMYVITGVAAILSPFALTNRTVAKVFGVLAWIAGMAWIFLAFTLFYSHVGFFPWPFNNPAVMHPEL